MTILKIGGSLFHLPDLGARIVTLIDRAAISQPVLFPGGGAMVDQLRDFDRRHQLPVELSHRLAIELLSVTAQMLAAMDDRFEVVDSIEKMPQLWEAEHIPVFNPQHLPQLDWLPASWHVTSDSLAAWGAVQWRARLILCKSVDLPDAADSLDVAVEAGWVDPCFPSLAGQLDRVDWVNLQRDPPILGVLKWAAAQALVRSRENSGISSQDPQQGWGRESEC